jgi:hypothetical protein
MHDCMRNMKYHNHIRVPYYWVKADNKWGVRNTNQEIILTIAFDAIGARPKKGYLRSFYC